MGVSNVLEHIHEAVDKARNNTHDVKQLTKAFREEKDFKTAYCDIVIQFIGANNLPRMDVVGSADPYFVAKIDGKISFVSTVKPNTLAPVWNEVWRIKNVPLHAALDVKVFDKDEGPTDDYIGKFETTISPGTKEAEIEGPILKRSKGTFWLKIDSTPSNANDAADHPYLFDGPIRYSRHNSPTVGRLTNINDARLYSTWKMYIKGIPLFFGDRTQHWNVNYKAAQDIFQGPASIAVRSGIQAGHRLLYARTTANAFGTIESSQDILGILWGGKGPDGYAHRVKPAVYTYVIAVQDDSFRFSETGAAFFVDFASKHALHSNCAEAVKWELVIDNNSGTYSPDPALLPDLKALLEYNFPGFDILAMSHEDPELGKSTDACRKYALEHRGVHQEEFQPHKTSETEETLSHASLRMQEAKEEIPPLDDANIS
ncbi:hypothetical protein PLICRDRAFT_160880 [Plicaturopsis crispa FD-325 SS-3]|nr:hypothetical protein PLICRDRAFT_160880 [Plicaturopsis crispa FD-325 SS-3]